jgi:hypothetical protein
MPTTATRADAEDRHVVAVGVDEVVFLAVDPGGVDEHDEQEQPAGLAV